MTTAAPPRTALVVETDVLLREVMIDILMDEGFFVLEARDAETAMTTLAQMPGISVLFTGRRLPGPLDGIGLAHCVSERHPSVGLVVSSALAAQQLPPLPSGAYLLRKPFQFQEIVAAFRATAGTAADPALAVLSEVRC